MEQKVLMPLDIQMFAESGEENNANDNQEVDNTSKDTKANDKKETKASEKKYSDEELNAISLKNEQKALANQLKDLGIDDVEKAKSILAKAKEEEEKAKSVDEKTQEALKKAEKATLEAINTKIENALLRKESMIKKSQEQYGLLIKKIFLIKMEKLINQS